MSSPRPPSEAPRPRTWATHCCGCCCDMRTAVVAVNLVPVVLAGLALNATILDGGVLPPVVVAAIALRIAFSSLGAYGAVNYKAWPVGVNLVGYAGAGLLRAFALDVVGAIVYLSFAYPHYFFLRELNEHGGGGDASEHEIRGGDASTHGIHGGDASRHEIHTAVPSTWKDFPVTVV